MRADGGAKPGRPTIFCFRAVNALRYSADWRTLAARSPIPSEVAIPKVIRISICVTRCAKCRNGPERSGTAVRAGLCSKASTYGWRKAMRALHPLRTFALGAAQARREFGRLKPRHVQNVRERIEVMPPCQPRQFIRQRGYVTGRVRATDPVDWTLGQYCQFHCFQPSPISNLSFLDTFFKKATVRRS